MCPTLTDVRCTAKVPGKYRAAEKAAVFGSGMRRKSCTLPELPAIFCGDQAS
jgi:hypothetical protein